MRKIIYSLLFCGLALSASAQDTEGQQIGVYQQAEDDYDIGRIDTARVPLLNNIPYFQGNVLQSAYRLLALCDIATDNDTEAERYVKALLDENPYYSTTLNDPPRFIDMVNRIRSGRTATITTASSQSETLNEVPVPTTLITEEMIHNSGARNLQEVLAAYVPGMTIVDCNDDINIAMRGIYSNGQEKILIMLNGHRLNSYATNIASPDYSINLDKLKQIEVLRGPASSLYGGVSLTAVVNLITKQGADVDGIEARAGVGNYGQVRGSMLFGKRFFDLDMLVWGSFYRASGQKVYMPSSDTALQLEDGDITIGGVGSKPSYDIGISMKYKNLQFLYNTQFSQVISPMSMTYLFGPYNIDKYRTHNGIKPSFTTNSHHAELSYGQQLGSVYLKGIATYDNSDLTHYQVISDPQVTALADVLPLPEQIKEVVRGHEGISRYINGQEHTFGAKLQGDWNYINNNGHQGYFSFGAEGSYFQLDDVRYTFGYAYTASIPESNTISELGKGHESNINAFAQLKHHWGPFIFNAGLRFDYKSRYNDTKIKEFSPRLALIFVQPKWNVKLSYSKAFIDAPYLYRKTNLFLAEMMGVKVTENLEPESLHSYQLTFGANQWLKGLDFEINGFYNRARDLIYLELYEHYNTGNIDTYGVEVSGSYKYKTFSANLALAWQKIRKSEIFSFKADQAFNTPEISVNTVLAWRPVKPLNIHTHLSFYGSQKSLYIDIFNYSIWTYNAEGLIKYVEQYEANPTPELAQQIQIITQNLELMRDRIQKQNDVASRFLWDLGADYTIGKLNLGFNIHNVLNKNYYQSGMSTTVIPQRGRWFMVDIAYKF